MTKSKRIEPERLKLKGSIKNKDITILVDSSNICNLVDTKSAKQVNLFVYPVKNLIVSIINDEQVEGVGGCHKVSLQIPGTQLHIRCYVLPLREVDIVL